MILFDSSDTEIVPISYFRFRRGGVFDREGQFHNIRECKSSLPSLWISEEKLMFLISKRKELAR